MVLLLKRRPTTDNCTLGDLFVDGVHEAFTLEDVVREGPKVMHETAIPPGRYRVDITLSARFGRLLPELVDVPGFTGIRIHSGNTSADTSGCILVGRSQTADRVSESRVAMDALQPKIAAALARGEDVRITIENPTTGPGPLKA